MKNNKKYIVILSILFIFILGYNLLNKKIKSDYEKQINNPSNYNEIVGVDIPKDSKVLENENSQEGFLGDGETSVEINLSYEGMKTFINEASKSKGWDNLPMEPKLESLLLGGELEGVNYGGLVNITNNIENGMYYFLDRYSLDYPKEANIYITERSSYNFDFAILDTDKKKLYICQFDT